jgi:predicted SprT family Zn-dependent metalloprotease
MSEDDALVALKRHYHITVDEKFAGALPRDFAIAFNPNLRRLTGRITYGARLIEISRWHFARYGLDDARATLEHELLHLHLHEQGLPSGHTLTFKRLAAEKGIRVFHTNSYPRNQSSPWRWLYECPACGRHVWRTRPMKKDLACGPCCRTHAGGSWDLRFALALLRRVRMV